MSDHTKVAATTGGAIGISAIASFIGLCCIGPWAVVLFGVSGAVTMATWPPFRPYILAGATVMLAWAFWRVYRPRPACDDGSCPTGPSRDSGRMVQRQLQWSSMRIGKRSVFAYPTGSVILMAIGCSHGTATGTFPLIRSQPPIRREVTQPERR